MKRPWLLFLLAVSAHAQDPGAAARVKDVAGVEGRIKATVPDSWRPQQPSGNIVLRATAPHGGGHDLMVVRESGQDDVDKQRDRYIQYDSGKHAGAEVKKYNQPFFGYRLDAPGENRVVLRAFITDGADGLVISLSSRLKMYDRVWADKMLAVMKSVRVEGGPAARPEAEGKARRLYDDKARVSLVAPAAWKKLPSQDEDELLYLGLKGSRGGPNLRVVFTGTNTNEHLVLSVLSRRWKQSYASVTLTKVAGTPARLLARNRKPGWIDYVTPFAPGGDGYALILAAREGSYERYRTIADAVAETVVFAAGGWAEPTASLADIKQDEKDFVLHLPAELASSAGAVAKHAGQFQRAWSRIAIGESRKAPPLHILVADEKGFADASGLFGDRPAAYNPSARAVVALAPPDGDDELARWRGALFGALTQAAQHRNLEGRAPPWLTWGLVACMQAAGRGRKPDEPHPALVKILDIKIATDAHLGLRDVLRLSHADYILAPDVDNLAITWGYMHLMLFGSGTVTSTYKKFERVLAKAKGAPPELDLKKYDRDRDDLKRHAERQKWLK